MVKIGVTGGIGSGKSTVCNVWQSLGAVIINADDLAKNIMTDNDSVKQAIISTFGSQSYHPDGSLNRTFLAAQAFGNGRVKELNAIVHPRIPARVEELMINAEKEGARAAVYEAALLLQNLRPKNLDYVVLILADDAQRLQWVQNRDEVSEKSVADRMHNQQNFNDLIPLADCVIENNGTLQELKEKAKMQYQKLVNAKTE